jgi:hypothetical protein
MIRGFDHPGDYANLNSYQLRDGTFMRARNLFEWQLQNPQGEIVQSGRAGNVAQARLDGRAAERQNRGK